MRIGLISDIHANLRGLLAVLDALAGVDAILCAGDLTGYYSQPNEVIDELNRRRIPWIAGNHDVYVRQTPPNPNENLRKSIEFTRKTLTPANAALLAAAPSHMSRAIDGLRIEVYHGSPWNPVEQYIFPNFDQWDQFATVEGDVIVLGHTHRPLVRDIAGKVIVNPGSVGQPRGGDIRASYAILDTATRQAQLERVAFDLDAADADARANGLWVPKR